MWYNYFKKSQEVVRMNRKVLALLVSLALLFACIPGQAAALSDVCFVAVNDTMPDSIPQAYVRYSVTYVPSSALSSFRIYSLYDSAAATALIYTSDQQITFDMAGGTAKDKDGISYSSTAIYRNGQVYVPAVFICSMFDLHFSYIEGSGFGDIARITDGSEVLDDALFLNAATNLMRTRYDALQQAVATPAPTPTVQEPHGDAVVYLTFLGLPTNYLLNLLKNYGFTATFFLTEANIAEQPETVRRIVGDGHNVGIYCQTAGLQDADRTADILFEAAHIKTVLVTAGVGTSQEFISACQEAGYVPCQYDINGLAGQNGLPPGPVAMIHRLNTARGNRVLMLALTRDNDNAVRSVITHLYTNADSFAMTTVREVGYTGGRNDVR